MAALNWLASSPVEIFYDAEEHKHSALLLSPPPVPVLRPSSSNSMQGFPDEEDLTFRKLITAIVREPNDIAPPPPPADESAPPPPADIAAAEAAPVALKARKSVSFASLPHKASQEDAGTMPRPERRRDRKTMLVRRDTISSSADSAHFVPSTTANADRDVGAGAAATDASFVLQPLFGDGRTPITVDASTADANGQDGSLTIGRQHPSATSNHGIHDSRVSRRHAQLAIGGANSPCLVVTAVGINPIGVHLAGEAADEPVRRPVLHQGMSAALRHGDRVQLILDNGHPSLRQLDSSPGQEACAYRVTLLSADAKAAESSPAPPPRPHEVAPTSSGAGFLSPSQAAVAASAPTSKSPPQEPSPPEVITPEGQWLRRVLRVAAQSLLSPPPQQPAAMTPAGPVGELRALRSAVASAIERATSQLAEDSRKAEAQGEALRDAREEKATLQQQKADLERRAAEMRREIQLAAAEAERRVEEEQARVEAEYGALLVERCAALEDQVCR